MPAMEGYSLGSSVTSAEVPGASINMPKTNTLLACLEPEAWRKAERQLTQLQLVRGDVVHRPGEGVANVVFPTSAVVALGLETVAGESVNVALVGREGALGAFEACGSRQTYTRAVVQVAGVVWRMSAASYRDLFTSSDELRRGVHKYMEILVAESRQSTACNALHSVESRLARALLEVSEKARSLKLPVTQDSLSHLLGVQRTTVAAAVSALQRQGLIRSGRGVIEVLRQEGLGDVACSCRETLAFVKSDIHSRVVDVCEA